MAQRTSTTPADPIDRVANAARHLHRAVRVAADVPTDAADRLADFLRDLVPALPVIPHQAPPPGVEQITTCPTWCPRDHDDDQTIAGILLGVTHELVLADLTAEHPAWTDTTATARVSIESSTEDGEITDPPAVIVTLVEGTGEQGVQGWSGTPDQARALANALLAGADLIDRTA